MSDLRDELDRIPPWVSPVVLAVTTVILFREFLFGNDMLFGSDTLALGYTARAFFAEALGTTGFPAWNPHIMGGTPFLESLIGGDALHPVSVALLWLMEPWRALGWKLVLHVFMGGLFMYGWLRTLGTTRGAGLIGGLAFLLSPWMVSLVFPGHDGKIYVTAMTPAVFWLSEWMWRRRDLLPGALLGLAVATVILSTHFQMAYFLFGAVGAYMIFRTVQRGRGEGWSSALRTFGLFIGFSVVGAGAAGVQLVPAVDYVVEHSRRTATTTQAASPAEAVAYSSSWSLHPEEIVSLAVPEFVGASTGGEGWTADTYWGRNAFKLNHEYIGVAVLLLALLSLLGPLRGKEAGGIRWFMVGMGGVAVLYALGSHTPVWRVFWEVVPGIRLFRAPSMVIFLAGFAAITLMAFGIDRVAGLLPAGRTGKRVSGSGRQSEEPQTPGDPSERFSRALLGLGAATTVLALGGMLAATGMLLDLWLAIFDPGLDPVAVSALDRAEPFIVRGLFVAVAVGAVLSGIWWAAGRGRIGGPLLVTLLALVVGADLYRVDRPFIRVVDPAQVTVPDANHRFLLERQASEPPFRVFSMLRGGQDVAPATFGLDLAAGHHPNGLARYNEFIGMEGSGAPETLLDFNQNALYLLNVRYLLWPGELQGTAAVRQMQYADGAIHSSIYPYPGGPRARVVGRYQLVPPDQTLAAVLDEDRFDPSVETILEERPPFEPGGSPVTGEVEWLERTPDQLRFSVTASAPALVVLSENWFPAWRARIGEDAVPVLRADHAFRAVPVPEGTSEVVMYYESPLVNRSFGLSVACLLLLTGAGVGAGVRRRLSGGRAIDAG